MRECRTESSANAASSANFFSIFFFALSFALVVFLVTTFVELVLNVQEYAFFIFVASSNRNMYRTIVLFKQAVCYPPQLALESKSNYAV